MQFEIIHPSLSVVVPFNQRKASFVLQHLALEAHQSKCFHLGSGRKPIAKTTLATANQNRDYHIFEKFAFYMMEQARQKRAEDIFKLGGKVS